MNTLKVLFTETQINQRVSELAAQISMDYAGKTLDIVCLVNSSSFFCVDLVRCLTIPSKLHFLGFSPYLKGNETGEMRITLDVNEPLFARDILVIEGLVVSGRTPRYLLDLIQLRQPNSLALCALGVKPKQLLVRLPLHYVGFELDAEVAVGYGIGTSEEKTRACLFEKLNVNSEG